MKRFRYIQTVFVAMGLVLVFYSCCRDDDNTCSDPTNPECENYDPCYGKIPTTAEFTIAQQYLGAGPNADIYFEDDTVTGGTLKFIAKEQEGATYTWILGIDTIVGGYEITKPLGVLPEGSYSNSLIVTKQADTICFPNDEGIAQFNRSFIKINGCDRVIFGRYFGVFSKSPTDSVEIELIASSSYTHVQPCHIPSNEGGIFSVNFNLNGDTIRLKRYGLVNKRMSFKSEFQIGVPDGEIIYDSYKDQVTAIYSIDDVDYHFTGRKL